MDCQLLIVAKSIQAIQKGGLTDSGKREYRLWWAWSDRGSRVDPIDPPGVTMPLSDYGSGVVAGQSALFTNVDADNPANIEGGIPIYPPRNPSGAVSLVVGLAEIDKDYEQFGYQIEKARTSSVGRQAIDYLSKGPLGPLVTFVDLLPVIFKKIGEDDNHGFGIFNAWEVEGYGFDESNVRTWQVKSKKAIVTLEAKLFKETDSAA